jgi:Patatin-like phospholipase
MINHKLTSQQTHNTMSRKSPSKRSNVPLLTEETQWRLAPSVPRILSLDGGGVRALSSLLILREIMLDIEQEVGAEAILPCEYFDLIGGTDSGGLIAIMLGGLCMVMLSQIAANVDT